MRLYLAERLILLCSLALVFVNLTLQAFKGIPSPVDHYALVLVPGAILLVIGQGLRRYQSTERLASVFHIFALVFFFVPQGANLIFLILPLHAAPIDTTLVQLDSLLGLSWPAWCAWIAQHPAFNQFVRSVYLATLPAVPLSLIFLAMVEDVRRVQVVELAVVIALAITIACWALLPSAGASSVWQLDPAIDAVVQPVVDSAHGAKIVTLMSEGITELGTMEVGGMIGFPSYHTALGMFILLGLWPYMWARIVLSCLAPILAIGILTHGGHALMDLFGGLAVAGLAWWAATRIVESYGHADAWSRDQIGAAGSLTQATL